MSRGRRLAVLGICSMSLFIVGLDTTIVNVALPSFRRSLGATLSELQWTIDGYTLVLASLLVLAGSTADRVGRKRIFSLGLIVFALGSLACGLAPSVGLLVLFRVVQALGGSMLNPVALSIIRNVFEDPRERAQAIGVWGAMFGLSIALGPIVGGALVQSVGWRAVFMVNVPVGALALLLTTLYVPESRAPRHRRIDPVGQLLVIAALASLTYSIIEAPRRGWGSPTIVILLAVSATCFISLVRYELRRREPLLEMRFFRSAPFAGASATAVLAFAGQGGFLFLNTLYLQGVRGLSALDAGLYLLPMAVTILIFAPLSGRVVGRLGARLPLVLGGLGLCAGDLMLTRLTPSTGVAYLLVAYLLFGAGLGWLNAPITNTAVSGMPPSQAGVAASIASTSRQVGTTLGVAVIGAIAGGGITGRIPQGLAAASHPAWYLSAALALVIIVLGIVTTSDRARRTAERTAALFQEGRPQAATAPTAS